MFRVHGCFGTFDKDTNTVRQKKCDSDRQDRVLTGSSGSN